MEKRKKTHFQRTKYRAYVRLGSGQKSKQRYKKATGRHNKTRQKWKSRPRKVEIGYKNPKVLRFLIKGKKPVLVRNLEDLKKVGKEEIIIIAKIGKKQKLILAEEIMKQGKEVVNLNIKKFLRKIERQKKKEKK